jgi:hypothetical protein
MRQLTLTELKERLTDESDPVIRKALKAHIVALSDPDPLTVTDDEDTGGLRPAGRPTHLRDEHPGQLLRPLRDRVSGIRRRLVRAHLGSHRPSGARR